MKRNSLGTCLVVAVTWSAIVLPASAQMGGSLDSETPQGPVEIRPPAPADPGKYNIIVPYLIAALLGSAAIGLAIMPSKRTHQD